MWQFHAIWAIFRGPLALFSWDLFTVGRFLGKIPIYWWQFFLGLIYCWAIFCWQLGSFSLKLSGHTDSFQTNLFFLLCSTKPQSLKTFSLESTLCRSLSIMICRLKSFDTSEQIKKIQFSNKWNKFFACSCELTKIKKIICIKILKDNINRIFLFDYKSP